MMRIFIGFDHKEAIAYHVLCHSILSRTSVPVSITPLVRSGLPMFTRKRGPLESTDFSISRFLVPYLSRYEGLSIFMDCDMLCRVDLADLLEFPLDAAVTVAQHDYTPRSETKFLGQRQTRYPRKNWSSLMVFDCAQCETLTLDYVNMAPALDLHRLNWIADARIGRLPLEWNWLVGEYPENPDAKILHYTLGGPWFPELSGGEHSREWFLERDAMLFAPVTETAGHDR